MSITRISGPDSSRQYFRITRVVTGKNDVVSVDKSKADRYEKLRNNYEGNYTDQKGNRYLVSHKELRWGLYGSFPGAIAGFGFADKYKAMWNNNKSYKFLNTLLFASVGYLTGMLWAQGQELLEVRKMWRMEESYKHSKN